jgi:uncharacterized protein YabE (DUF348 family)
MSNFRSMKSLFSESMSTKKWLIAISSFVVLVAVVGILFYEGTKKTIAVELDGEKKVVNTHADTVKELLDELNISFDSADYLFPSADTVLTNDATVVWEPAKQVTLFLNDEPKAVETTADTVGDLLKEQNLDLNEQDIVEPNIDQKITEGMEIAIKKAFEVTLIDGGNEKKVWSTSTTVADFLEQQEIKLNNLDKVNVALDSVVNANDVIEIIRVEKVTDVVEEPVDYAVVTKKDSKLLKGQQKVIQSGRKGLVSKTYEVVLENGKEVSRTLVSSKTIKESVDKIVAVGTKVLTAEASRGQSSNGKELVVTATAYTAYCNGCSGITATGINLKTNPNIKVIAVDPSVIPLGTKVYVEGYGYAVAADTGSAINGYKIDVFFPTKSEAYRWGNRKVKIKILD